jgi:hypothetical protein
MSHVSATNEHLTMAPPTEMKRDAAVYWAKYFRQGLATAPATVVAIIAGVSRFANQDFVTD